MSCNPSASGTRAFREVCEKLNVEDEEIRHHRDVFNPILLIRGDGYMHPIYAAECAGKNTPPDDDEDDCDCDDCIRERAKCCSVEARAMIHSYSQALMQCEEEVPAFVTPETIYSDFTCPIDKSIKPLSLYGTSDEPENCGDDLPQTVNSPADICECEDEFGSTVNTDCATSEEIIEEFVSEEQPPTEEEEQLQNEEQEQLSAEEQEQLSAEEQEQQPANNVIGECMGIFCQCPCPCPQEVVASECLQVRTENICQQMNTSQSGSGEDDCECQDECEEDEIDRSPDFAQELIEKILNPDESNAEYPQEDCQDDEDED